MNTPPKIFYENRFMDAVPVASSTAAGDYHVLNLREWKAYTFWKPLALPATITVDCGADKAADYANLWAHNLGSMGCTAEVRHSTDNFAANDVLAATVTPADDRDLKLEFASIARRYWRWRFTGANLPTIAIAPIGVALVFPRRLQQGFGPVDRAVKGQFNITESGHPIERVKAYTEWAGTAAMRNIPQSWVRDSFLPAWAAHLENRPFGFSWDPTDHPTELYLCQGPDQFPAPHGAGEFCDFSLSLRARTS